MILKGSEKVNKKDRKLRIQGNSLMVALTPAAIEILDLKEGDILYQEVKGKKIIITKKEDK